MTMLGVHGAASGTGTVNTPAGRDSAVSGSSFLVIALYDGTFTSVADNKGNTIGAGQLLVAESHPTFLSGQPKIRAYLVTNGAGGTGHVFTLVSSGSAGSAIFFVEMPNGALSNLSDVVAAWVEDAATPFTTNASGTLAQANEFAVVFYATNTPSGTEVFTLGNGFTNIEQFTNAAADYCSVLGVQDVSSTASIQGTLTLGTGTAAYGIILTFKAAGAGAAGTDPGNVRQSRRQQTRVGTYQQMPRILRPISAAPSTAGAAAALAGNAQMVQTASGTLTTSIQLAGSALVVQTATGALTTGIPLAGNGNVVMTANGSLTAQIQLSGAALVQAIATGALSTGIPLSGAAIVQMAATGNLATAINLLGAAVDNVSAVGAITTAINMLAAATDVVTANGALSTAVQLAGAAADVVTATGALNAGAQLAASAQDVVTAGASLSAQITLLATAQDVVTSTAQLTAQIKLSAAAVAQAIATGSLTASITMNAAALLQATATGDLTAPGSGLAGNAGVVAAAHGALTASIQFAGAAGQIVGSTGTLTSLALVLDTRWLIEDPLPRLFTIDGTN